MSLAGLMSALKTNETPSALPLEIMTELQDAIADALSGVRDPEKTRQAAARMDRMREEMRRRIGVGEWAVSLTRETRDEG